jgi:hypothetical protein
MGAHFSRDQLHVLLLEDMREDPRAAYASACRFLGVSDEFVPRNLGRRVNAYQGFRSLPIRRLTKSLPRHGAMGGMRDAIGTLNRRRATYPEMSSEDRTALEAIFDPEIEALGKWLGRDLGEWTTSKVRR